MISLLFLTFYVIVQYALKQNMYLVRVRTYLPHYLQVIRVRLGNLIQVWLSEVSLHECISLFLLKRNNHCTNEI